MCTHNGAYKGFDTPQPTFGVLADVGCGNLLELHCNHVISNKLVTFKVLSRFNDDNLLCLTSSIYGLTVDWVIVW